MNGGQTNQYPNIYFLSALHRRHSLHGKDEKVRLRTHATFHGNYYSNKQENTQKIFFVGAFLLDNKYEKPQLWYAIRE